MVPGVTLNQIERIFKDYGIGSQYSKGVLQKVLLIFKTEDDKHVWLITEGDRVRTGVTRDFEFYGYKLKEDCSVEKAMIKLSTLCQGEKYFGSNVVAIIPDDLDMQLVADFM